MRRRNLILTIAIGFFQVFGGFAYAVSLPLQDPGYSFDQTKLAAAKNSFQFLRSYVDYFYLVLKANPSSLPLVSSLQSETGWCVGDAHPENFGVLIQRDGPAIFTMNDMDDSGPCPIVLDLIRLMVSSKLYDSNSDIDQLLTYYLKG